ncbi:segregation/condensation protein A [Candidatus Micrarchaeota archaeon]|nr:segregation/condensation protein A [Candidatus Micrarchaeota archaeon]
MSIAENQNAGSQTQRVDLLEMVAQPTWREFLTDLVASEKWDPGSIDLCKVADAYLTRGRALQALDLRIPANVILASALLLRFKAETLIFEEEAEVETEAPALIEEEIPDLVFRANRSRSRRVTLQELMRAVEEVMRQGKRLLPAGGMMLEPAILELELPKKSMSERMKSVLERALALKDEENLLLFSALVAAARKELNGHAPPDNAIVVHELLPVLHLIQEKKLAAWQDEFYGEIFLKILNEEETEETGEKQGAEASALKEN